MRFGAPWAFWLLLVLPFVVAALWYGSVLVFKARLKLGVEQTVNKQFAKHSNAKLLVSKVLLFLTVFALIVALIRPQFGGRSVLVKREGVDLLILLDVSRSMSARDTSPDRLTRSKMELMRLLDVLEGDRVGIVVFAGAAFVQCPLTTDYAAAKLFLKSIQIGDITKPGTAVGRAFALAQKLFKEGGLEGASKVVVLVTDGEDFDPDTENEFEKLKDMGVKVFTVGVGSAAGEPIPLGDKPGYLKENGKTVMSRRNDKLLKKFARASGAKYFNLQEGSDLTELANELKRLKRGEIKSKLYTQYDERFQYPLALALLFAVLAFVFDERQGSLFGLKTMFNRSGKGREQQ